MAEGGSWIFPEYRGQPRLKKPPLMYWAVAVAYRCAQDTRNLFAARIPSVAATLALSIILYGFGANLIGRRRALLAAAIAPSAYILLRQGRFAETDTMLAMFTSLAMLCGYQAIRKPRLATLWWLAAGLAAGMGFMTKGPAALILPPLTWIAYLWSNPGRFRPLFSRSILPGLLCFLLVATPWYLIITLKASSHFSAENQIEGELANLTTSADHRGTIFYYLYTTLHALAPWSLLLPFALAYTWKTRKRHAHIRFIFGWLISSFLVLTLTPNKQIHYCTLLAPPALLLIGIVMGSRRPLHKKWAQGLFVSLFVAMALAGAFFVGKAFVGETTPLRPSLLSGGILLVLATLALGLRTRNRLASIALYAVMMGTVLHFYTGYLYPIQSAASLVPQFLAENSTALASAKTVWAAGLEGSEQDFYSPVKLRHAQTPDAAWESASEGDLIIVTQESKHTAPPFPPARPPLVNMQRNDLRILLYRR